MANILCNINKIATCVLFLVLFTLCKDVAVFHSFLALMAQKVAI